MGAQASAQASNNKNNDSNTPDSEVFNRALLMNGDYGVYVVYEPPVGTKVSIDIVFFHGLQLGVSDTEAWWTSWLTRDGTSFWPQTFLPVDFPDARILSVCYPAKAGVQFESDGNFDWDTMALTLLNQCTSSIINVGKDNRPVVLVAHCIGGLLVKELMAAASFRILTDSSSLSREYAGQLFKNVIAVVFYATPHRGSAMPDWLFKVMPKVKNHQDDDKFNKSTKINKSNNSTQVNKCVQYMNMFDNNVANLNGRYVNIMGADRMRHVKHVSFAETTPTKLVFGRNTTEMMVVNKESAAYVLGTEPNTIDQPNILLEVPDSDHFTVCRPVKLEDPYYRCLVESVQHALAEQRDGNVQTNVQTLLN